MSNTYIRPAGYSEHPTAKEKWLRDVCTILGIDVPEQPETIVHDLRRVPSVGNIIKAAAEEGKRLSDIRDDLILSYVAESTLTKYNTAVKGAERSSDTFPARKESIRTEVSRHAAKTYTAARKALKALPDNAFDRDAIFEMDATKASKELVDAFQTLYVLAQVNGRNPGSLGIPSGFEVLQYVVIDPQAEGDFEQFGSHITKDMNDDVLVSVIRGEYGPAIKAQLPNADEVRNNYDNLISGIKAVRRAKYEANPQVNMPDTGPNVWKTSRG